MHVSNMSSSGKTSGELLQAFADVERLRVLGMQRSGPTVETCHVSDWRAMVSDRELWERAGRCYATHALASITATVAFFRMRAAVSRT